MLTHEDHVSHGGGKGGAGGGRGCHGKGRLGCHTGQEGSRSDGVLKGAWLRESRQDEGSWVGGSYREEECGLAGNVSEIPFLCVLVVTLLGGAESLFKTPLRPGPSPVIAYLGHAFCPVHSHVHGVPQHMAISGIHFCGWRDQVNEGVADVQKAISTTSNHSAEQGSPDAAVGSDTPPGRPS